jgi:hypothetical protein
MCWLEPSDPRGALRKRVVVVASVLGERAMPPMSDHGVSVPFHREQIDSTVAGGVATKMLDRNTIEHSFKMICNDRFDVSSKLGADCHNGLIPVSSVIRGESYHAREPSGGAPTRGDRNTMRRWMAAARRTYRRALLRSSELLCTLGLKRFGGDRLYNLASGKPIRRIKWDHDHPVWSPGFYQAYGEQEWRRLRVRRQRANDASCYALKEPAAEQLAHQDKPL